MEDLIYNKTLQELDKFDSVSLSDLERVSLLVRMDTKYAFNDGMLPQLLDEMRECGYRVLDISGRKIFKYDSVYYDTPDFALYDRHACGKLNRYKIRNRRYVDSGGSFFEIKFKNNRGRTIKSRVVLDSMNDKSKAEDLLTQNTPYDFSLLQEQMSVGYSRITLVSPGFEERVTIDINLSYALEDSKWDVQGIVIAELKQDRASNSVFRTLMKKHHIRINSLSKYCLGVARLAQGVKANSFKPQLLLVNKIQNAATSRPRQ
jgi:VTC domain